MLTLTQPMMTRFNLEDDILEGRVRFPGASTGSTLGGQQDRNNNLATVLLRGERERTQRVSRPKDSIQWVPEGGASCSALARTERA